MLTLFYVSATFLQSWRINKICQKITEQLSQKASIAFYTLPPKSDDGFDVSFATSPLCTNRKIAKVSEILWLLNDQRGCSLRPVQMVNVSPWVTFPEAPSFLPFTYSETPIVLMDHLKKRRDIVYLLLETDIQPSCGTKRGNLCEIIKVERYGKLVAWKVDSKLALIIETDVEHFTKLLIASFLQSNFLINDQLPLLRIESVYQEGVPQPFDLLLKHIKKPTRKTAELKPDEWEKHMEGLRAINVLASQAMEYQYNKNRTDAKASGMKPDLIPQNQKDKLASSENTKKEASSKPICKSPITAAEDFSKKKTPVSPEVKPMKVEVIGAENPIKATSPIENKSEPKSKDIPKTSVEKAIRPINLTDSSNSKSSNSPSAPSSILRHLSPTKSTDKSTGKLEKLAAMPSDFQTQSSNSNEVASISSPATTLAVQTSSLAPNEIQKTDMDVTNVSSLRPANITSPSKSIPPKTNNVKRPSLKRSKDGIKESKPLNILVYSDSRSSRDSTVNTLRNIVEPNMYTIYPLSSQQVEDKHWIENTALLVVCGYVISNIGEILVDYFLHGGKVLSLCSDILHFILPTYRTAEVREHELVQFSYDKWHNVTMMHHIFCYQPSPVKKHFSTESEESNHANSKISALVCPRSIELKDQLGRSHNLDVQVLGSEKTWNTPSLLLANNRHSGGKALFSQIHLETSPSQFEMDENKFTILKENEYIRLDIFSDLLHKYLNINVKKTNDSVVGCIYKQAYFLGRHEAKFELLDKLKLKVESSNVINTQKLTMAFCGKNDIPPVANANVLPILVHSCPEDFSTVDYFDNLKTNYVGRLVIYAPILNSTMNVINHLELTNGIAVIARQQTEGVGRSNNQWLSPMGCTMFSIQLHVTLESPLGSRLPLIQHIVGLAMVNTLKSHHLYKVLDIALKWPNDVYANGLNKIGGLIVQTIILGSNATANIGCGINLDNSKPTICINDLINDYNKENHQALPKIKYEEFVALMFNEIERLVEQVQNGNFDDFYKLYYDLWLHNNQTVSIQDNNGRSKEATICGIDDYGYLKVKIVNGSIETVQPDGNSFDMLKGLIVPKFF